MPGTTHIEWTDASWNPTTGCTQVSPGCAHCYAKTMTERFHGPGSFDHVVLHPDRLEVLLHWKKPRRVFVNSMSDLFHEDVPDDYIDRVFAVMALTPQHTYQVLTKRPERMREYVRRLLAGKRSLTSALQKDRGMTLLGAQDEIFVAFGVSREMVKQTIYWPENALPLPNIWLGVTVENQRWADERIPILLDTPATVRFVSAEPLLASVNLESYLYTDEQRFEGRDNRLDWVIVGGESGSRHRPFDPGWARSIVAQCHEASVACFVKQLGGARPGTALEDLPEDLRVREYPC